MKLNDPNDENIGSYIFRNARMDMMISVSVLMILKLVF